MNTIYPEHYTKIVLILSDDFIRAESVWAEKSGEDLYRLKNIPFQAFGYAVDDIVRCVTNNNEIQVTGIAHDSGNGTLRIMFANPESLEMQEVLAELVSVGCTYERASGRLVAVNVPPTLEIPFSQASNYLNSLGDAVVSGWEIGKRGKWSGSKE